MRKEILIGIGILIILLALAGTGSAWPSQAGTGCSGCHTAGGFDGVFYNDTHKFDGISRPFVADSCAHCHIQPPSGGANSYDMNLTGNGSYYNDTHRYNATILASERMVTPACGNCHLNATNNSFTILTSTPTYLNSSVCENCHKKKYDDWYGTMHRVMLTSSTSGEAMNLTLPEGNWSTTNVTYMIVGKTSFRYLNETGRFFSRYYAGNGTFATYSGDYTCGGCHTTGYNASGGNQSGLVGIWGTWEEEGIACENCHGPGGNGHQVTINKTGGDCLNCHYGDSRQGPAMTNKHATAPAEESTSKTCTHCHSPYNKYIGPVSNVENAANVTCLVCHNPHGTTDDKYGTLLSTDGFNSTEYAPLEDAKLSFFNGTASNLSKFNNGTTFTGTNASLVDGNDIFDILSVPASLYGGSSVKVLDSSVKDTSYDPDPINVTTNVSEVLCSKCHYRHGLAHVKAVNMTHGRNNASTENWASCIDCHMSKVGGKADHSFDAYNVTNYPESTCSKGDFCHVTSSENLALSNFSIVPIETEWKASLHNDKEVGNFYINETNFDSEGSNNSSCSKCHSPRNWNPANESGVVAPEDFKGITCEVCHNVHDMGDSINNSGLKYSWFNRDGYYSNNRYTATYELMDNTTELCGNCHASVRIGRSTPGWAEGASTPNRTHGFPAKDIFVGSWKQSSMLNFECIDCHMYINKTNATGYQLNDSSKIGGHSFKVNATGLQNTSKCNACHVNGTGVDEIRYVIAKIQADTQAKLTPINASVYLALDNYTAYTAGVKTLSAEKIAQAYWNVRLVRSDESLGVHDPVGTIKLLDEALALAKASDASLGMAVTSNVDLVAGWNLVALNGTPADTTPASVMLSVKDNISVVWGYNATGATWELYDPAMPTSLNTLKSMVMGKGYWIYAKQNDKWTV